MPSWYAIKLRLPCPECGESTIVEGPWARMRCVHCGTSTSITFLWGSILAQAAGKSATPTFQSGYYLNTGEAIPGCSYGYAAGMPPTCTCGVELDVSQIADGTDGTFPCPTCGAQHETYPAPPFLSRIRQVFLGVRDEDQGVEVSTPDARPVMFACTGCGAALKITTETLRIVSCAYCEVDLFLPAQLWNQLHPIRKRRVFWLRSK